MNNIYNKDIDITMTGVLRPTILNSTLKSINDKIVKKNDFNFRLILNIDPIGENVKIEDVINIAKKWFPNLIYNIPNIPSFPKAVKWVWSQVMSDFVFHIEDDWIINDYININDMIDILNKYEKLSSLRLFKHNNQNKTKIYVFNSYWNYKNEGFYLSKDWRKQFGLNPILIKKTFIDQVLPNMKDDINPEKQFRESQKFMSSIIKNWQYGLYCKPGQKALVKDIGRKWIERSNYIKPQNTTFLTWLKKE